MATDLCTYPPDLHLGISTQVGGGHETPNPTEVHANKVAELGFDQTALDLTSIEAIAAALRRAANFLCPCAATTLVRAVAEPHARAG